ncbi:MAG: hypothetical protein AABY27_03060, partial [Pseudomonadota bacterium]
MSNVHDARTNLLSVWREDVEEEIRAADIPQLVSKLGLDKLAQEKFKQGLNEILNSESITGEFHLTKSKKLTPDNSVSFEYKVMEDSLDRTLIFVSSDNNPNIIINTKWQEEYSVEGYEFSYLGPAYKMLSNPQRINAMFLVNKFGSSLAGQLQNKGVIGLKNLQLIEIDKYLLANNDEKNMIPLLTRYIVFTDPLGRDYARIENGQTTFIKWQDKNSKNVPVNVSPGEIAIVPGIGILRETGFYNNNSDRKEYVYRVLSEYRNGRRYSRPNTLISYNYQTGIVSEHYVDEEWKLYSRDNWPLYMTRVKGNREYLNSMFSAKTYSDGANKYILISERIITSTPYSGPIIQVVKNSQLWVKAEGEGASYFFHTDPYKDNLKEQFYNSAIPRMIRKIFNDKSPEKIIEDIKSNGTDVNTKDISPRNLSIYVDYERKMLNWVAPLFLVFPVLLTFVTALYIAAKKRFDRKHVRNNVNTASFEDIEEALREYSYRDPAGLASKVVILREVSGPLTITANISSAHREREF